MLRKCLVRFKGHVERILILFKKKYLYAFSQNFFRQAYERGKCEFERQRECMKEIERKRERQKERERE